MTHVNLFTAANVVYYTASQTHVYTDLCYLLSFFFFLAAMFYILENDWLFWPSMVSLMLAITLFLLIMGPYIAEMITRAVFGSFFLVIALDYYVGTNLKYIIITFVRRLIVTGFNAAYIYPPNQGLGTCLCVSFSFYFSKRCSQY